MTSMLVASGAGGGSTDESSLSQTSGAPTADASSDSSSAMEQAQASYPAAGAPQENEPPVSQQGGFKVQARGSRESLAQSAPDADAQIRELIAKGEARSAVELMMQEYKDHVYSFTLRIVQNESAARDVLQQTFLGVLRDLKNFSGRSTVKTWIIGIANHRAIDYLRKNTREARWISHGEEMDDLAESAAPEAPVAIDNHRQSTALEECLTHVSPRIRAVLLARFQHGLSYEEMAAETGEKPGTLQARVQRAFPKLRRCLEGKGFFEE